MIPKCPVCMDTLLGVREPSRDAMGRPGRLRRRRHAAACNVPWHKAACRPPHEMSAFDAVDGSSTGT